VPVAAFHPYLSIALDPAAWRDGKPSISCLIYLLMPVDLKGAVNPGWHDDGRLQLMM